MILIDTSIWVDHFRRGNLELVDLITAGEALVHPFVIGELACGSLTHRREKLRLLARLPFGTMAELSEVLRLVEDERLMAMGIGWVDAHLLGSALLSDAGLWTRDSGLVRAARKLGVLAREPKDH